MLRLVGGLEKSQAPAQLSNLDRMKRKAVQKSHDASSRRSAVKPAKTREEHSTTDSPGPQAFQVDIPKGLRDILIKSRAQIKHKEKVRFLARLLCSSTTLTPIELQVTHPS